MPYPFAPQLDYVGTGNFHKAARFRIMACVLAKRLPPAQFYSAIEEWEIEVIRAGLGELGIPNQVPADVLESEPPFKTVDDLDEFLDGAGDEEAAS